VITGYEGEIVADPVAADLVRLTVRTGELPSSTGTCETRTQMEYQRLVIGEMDLLLPATTRQRFVMRNGAEGENTATFSSCREYRGESTLRFLEERETETASVSAVPKRAGGLPGNLPVRLDLAAPLDTWTASGGEMIVLRLAKPIVGAAKQVLVPAGAAIQARVMRVQRFFTKPERVTVVVAPETIERAGAQLPFAVRPARFAELHFVGDHVVLPKGYHTIWRTAAIANP